MRAQGYETVPRSSTPILKKRDSKPPKRSVTWSRLQDSGDETPDEDSQRWTPPVKRRDVVRGGGSREDTPRPPEVATKHQRTSAESRYTERIRRRHLVSLSESSSSESDTDIKPSQAKHFMKPPKFDGQNMPFETFYTKFQICAKYNGWNKSEQLAFLSAALTGEAGQVLWDSNENVTGSVSKLTSLLKSRFGGRARADKYRMELRSRSRQEGESLEKLHQDIRRYMALAYSEVDTISRETLGCEYFLNALKDADFAMEVRKRNPVTLDEALLAAQQIEVWVKDAARMKQEEKPYHKERATRGTGPSRDDYGSRLDRIEKAFQKLSAQNNVAEVSKPAATKSATEPDVTFAANSMKPSRADIRCYNCDEVGHVARWCPKPKRQQRWQRNAPATGKETTTEATIEDNAGSNTTQASRGVNNDLSYVYMPIQIKRSRMQCTLDSGSDVTIVPHRLVQKFRLKIRASPIKQLKAVNGSGVVIDGATDVPLIVGGRLIKTSALVSKDVFEIIVGSDWLREHRCNWDFQNDRISIDGGQWVQLNGCRSIICGRIYVDNDIVVPPRVQCNVPVHVAVPKPSYKLGETMLESRRLRQGVYIGRTLLPAGQKRDVQVSLLNITDEEQFVRSDTCLGTVCSVDIVTDEDVAESNETSSETGSELATDNGTTNNVAGCETSNDTSNETMTKLIENLPCELTVEQKMAASSLLEHYADIFSRNEYDIGRTPLVEHHIDTTNHRPIRQPLRRHPVAHQEVIDNHVAEMQRNGIIEPAASPWASNVVLVRKKDGGLRFCIDYRALNAVTYQDTYPLPRIDSCLDTLHGASWFTTLDLRAGYYNIPVAEQDRDKTAFVTRRGCWRFAVMPFGLTCAPSVFQRLMDMVLAGLGYETCLVYLDDVIIFGKTFEELLQRTDVIFDRIRSAKLKLKPSKCSFFSRKSYFLGFIVSEAGIEAQPEKVKVVAEWPTPRNLHDLRSFLGLCSYYRRFVAGFSSVAAPLYELQQKDRAYIWSDECNEAFRSLKRSLTTAPILALPADEGCYILDTDASNTGLGAILSQIQDGEEKVIGYASRTLSRAERNYDTTKKELLAVVNGLKQYRQYLLGRHFVVRTDHAALSWLRRSPEPMPQLARWLTFIEEFNFEVQHRAGRKHQNADSLSRRPNYDEPEPREQNASMLRISAVNRRRSIQGSEMSMQAEAVADPLAGENFVAEQLKDHDIGPILRMKQCNENQPPIEALLTESEVTKIYWSQWDRLTVHNGILCRRFYGNGTQPNVLQMIVPATLRHEAVKRCHTGMAGGHLGAKKTTFQVCRRFYWHGWKGDVTRFCRRCVECSSYHRGQLPRTAPLHPIETGAPFERLSIDLTGPHCKSNRGHIWILTCVDPYTKWAEAFPLRNKEAETVARVLVEQVFTRFGTPIALLSDRGNEVDSNVMRNVCQLLGIDKMRTTSYRPSTNAAAERFHRTLNSMLGKVVAENQKDWDTHLPLVMAAYRASRHESTGYSPNFLVMGREARAPLDVVLDLPVAEGEATNYDEHVSKLNDRLRYAYSVVQSHLGRAAERAKHYYDMRVRKQRYTAGDWVSYYNPRHFRGREDKWSRKFSGPFLVLNVLPPVNLKLQRSPHTKPFIVHNDRVKPWTGDAPKSWLPNVVESESFEVVELPPIVSVDPPISGDESELLPAAVASEAESPAALSADTTMQKEACNENGNQTGIEVPTEVDEVTNQPRVEPLVVVAPTNSESVVDVYEADELPQARPQRNRRRPAHLEDYCTD